MSITNYTDLQQNIQNWLNRSDISNQVTTFIQIAENKLARKLRVLAMEETVTTTIENNIITLPDDYREMKLFFINASTTTTLKRLPSIELYRLYPRSGPSGQPKYFSREGYQVSFGPIPDDDYSVTYIYYKKIDALSSSNLTNWYTDNAPELLLYGALLEAEPYIKNDERVAVWQSKFDDAWNDIKAEDKRERMSGSLVVPVSGRY
jgi:hypothetical protein